MLGIRPPEVPPDPLPLEPENTNELPPEDEPEDWMVTLLDGMLPDEAIPLDEFVIAPLLEGQLVTDDELEELIPPPDVTWLLEGLVVDPLLDGELPLDETGSPLDDPESVLLPECEELGEPLEEMESDPELIVKLDEPDEDELPALLEELL